MKYLLFFSILFVFACKGSTDQSASEDTTKAATEIAAINTVSANLVVEGMTCTGCENTIKSNVADLDGVSEVIASHSENSAVVMYNPELTDTTAIKEKIIASGYTVVTIALAE